MCGKDHELAILAPDEICAELSADRAHRDTLKGMRTAFIGMGGNLASWAGAPEATLTAAAQRLESLGRVGRRSSLYSTEPVGFAQQPTFLNAVVELETALKPRALLEGLLAIEQEFGRDRAASFVNGPRTLDLDILLLGELTIREPELEIPHPRLNERAFVLVPLSEIAPELLVPGRGATVGELLASLQADTDAVVRISSETWPAR